MAAYLFEPGYRIRKFAHAPSQTCRRKQSCACVVEVVISEDVCILHE
jgi:hypothetical protein